MDKEDCIQVLLAALQQPWWKSCNSVTDWDLKNVLWKAGLLLTPEQVAALFADMKRRGLISGQDRRTEGRIVALWGVRITPAGEEWLAQHAQALPGQRESAEGEVAAFGHYAPSPPPEDSEDSPEGPLEGSDWASPRETSEAPAPGRSGGPDRS